MKSRKTYNTLINKKNAILFGALTVIASHSMAEMSSNVQDMYISKGEYTMMLNTVDRMHENIYLRLKNLQEDKLNRIKAEILAEQDRDCADLGYQPGVSC